jgi:hypothetical protein
VTATVSSGLPGRLGLLSDELTAVLYLVDTGSVYSILPHSSPLPPSGPKIMAADKTPISCWGWRRIKLKSCGRVFEWNFLLAAVAFPLVGADFLIHFRLMVDLARARLQHTDHGWTLPLAAPPQGSLFAAIGVQPADGSSPSGECTGGGPGTCCSPPSSPPSPARAEPRAASGLTAAQSGPPVSVNCPLKHVINEFPAVLNPGQQLPPVVHHVQHFIETTGRASASKYRRLDPPRLAAAKDRVL